MLTRSVDFTAASVATRFVVPPLLNLGHVLGVHHARVSIIKLPACCKEHAGGARLHGLRISLTAKPVQGKVQVGVCWRSWSLESAHCQELRVAAFDSTVYVDAEALQ